jgi:rhamnosyltransferase
VAVAVSAVSVVLVTKNGEATLPALLGALAAQRVPAPPELVAVDSGSTDRTVRILADHGARVLTIPPAEFNHGETRNLGIAAARSDIVVLVVQDALPANPDWLGTLTAAVTRSPDIAGAFARQLPSPGASALTRHYLESWVAAAPEPRLVALDAPAFAALTPARRHQLCVFDNVCSCLRRSVWERHPFPRTPIAEDLAWGREVLLAGWRLAYEPKAVVLHSHERSVRHEFARTKEAHARLAALFDLRTLPTRANVLRALAWTIPHHLAWWVEGPRPQGLARALVRAMMLAVAYPLGQYLGARGVAYEAPSVSEEKP